MSVSQRSTKGPEPLRIAPHLHMEDTKLTPTPTAAPSLGVRAPNDHAPAARRDAFGNRVAATPSAAPLRFERRARPRPSPPVEQPKPGFKMNRMAWLVLLAVVALIVSLAI